MPVNELFPRGERVGVFKGFQEGGLEFHADLVLPYRNEFQSIPMHGQFILVQLETEDEAVLGRITAFSSEGKLSSGAGEDYTIRAMQEEREVPEDLKEQYLRYRVNIRVLGVLRRSRDGKVTFVPSVRRLPHVGSPVAFPSDELLKELVGSNVDGADIGHYALGEYVYAQAAEDADLPDWVQVKSPEIRIRFALSQLVARRTMVFARAGFGKSNLVKLLFSELYKNPPKVRTSWDQEVPVGTIIFDREGEYFWPDANKRPGLCDALILRDSLVVFTSRQSPSPFYGSFVAGGIKLDIRGLPASDVIAIAVDQERQDQQNVRKLRALNSEQWSQLVDLVYRDKGQADITEVARLLGLQDADKSSAEATAALSNMLNVVRMLHDPNSRFVDLLMHSLKDGKLCIVDVSQMSGQQALVFSGLILHRIFDRNQQEFIKARPEMVPTIAVLEEAQSVLSESDRTTSPYVSWVKEGRKYNLGAVLVTQQPGSIATDILSQGDNWFVFHLLAAADLMNLKKANAHFSDDLLSCLLNEPIPGQGVFWSSSGGKPYPVSIRVLSFEKRYERHDPTYTDSDEECYAHSLRLVYSSEGEPADHGPNAESPGESGTQVLDRRMRLVQIGAEVIQQSVPIQKALKDDSCPFAMVVAEIQKRLEGLPDRPDDPHGTAYVLAEPSMVAVYGSLENQRWHKHHKIGKNKRNNVYFGLAPKPEDVD